MGEGEGGHELGESIVFLQSPGKISSITGSALYKDFTE